MGAIFQVRGNTVVVVIKPIVCSAMLVVGRCELNFLAHDCMVASLHLRLMLESLYNGVVGRTTTPVTAMLSWVRQGVRAFCVALNCQDGDEVHPSK